MAITKSIIELLYIYIFLPESPRTIILTLSIAAINNFH